MAGAFYDQTDPEAAAFAAEPTPRAPLTRQGAYEAIAPLNPYGDDPGQPTISTLRAPHDIANFGIDAVATGANLIGALPEIGYQLATRPVDFLFGDPMRDAAQYAEDSRSSWKTPDPAQAFSAVTSPLVMGAGAPMTAAKVIAKSGNKVAGAFGATARELDDLGFYSALDEELGKFNPKDRVTLDTLSKRGVKAAELEARGVLDLVKRGATAQEIKDAAGGAVRLNEVKYGGPDNDVTQRLVRMDSRNFESDGSRMAEYEIEDGDTGDVYTITEDIDAGNVYVQGPRGTFLDVPGDLNSQDYYSGLAAIERSIQDKDAIKGVSGPANYSDYSLDPSNPTYRETVLHLPQTTGQFESWKVTSPSGRSAIYTSEENARKFANPGDTVERQPDMTLETGFRSGHFPEPNIIGHMMTSMVEHEGKPTFLVDQIQSDWGQRLRDGGVRDEAKIAELRAREEAASKAIVDAKEASSALSRSGIKLLKDINGSTTMSATDGPQHIAESLRRTARTNPDHPNSNMALALAEQLQKFNLAPLHNNYRLASAELSTAEASTPGNPLVNTTDQWVNTTLRRALRQAVDSGADRIAIPSGDTVLGYNPGDAAGMAGFYGGAGQEGIVPKNLRKMLAKIDKEAGVPMNVDQLQTTQGPAGQGFTVYPITDAVREVAKKGFPLFNKAENRPLAGVALADRANGAFQEEEQPYGSQ